MSPKLSLEGKKIVLLKAQQSPFKNSINEKSNCMKLTSLSSLVWVLIQQNLPIKYSEFISHFLTQNLNWCNTPMNFLETLHQTSHGFGPIMGSIWLTNLVFTVNGLWLFPRLCFLAVLKFSIRWFRFQRWRKIVVQFLNYKISPLKFWKNTFRANCTNTDTQSCRTILLTKLKTL